MTICSFIILITVCLSHGFEVIQPQNRTVNADASASISCEHTANVSSVQDVRLNGLSLTDKPRLLCQKGMLDCTNVIMYPENPNKCLFILLNIGPEDMAMTYQCEFTVKINGLHYTKTGSPTTLLPGSSGQQEATCAPHPAPAPPQLRWIPLGFTLTGLLVLTLLTYSCVITSFYVRQKCSKRDPENSTYVEMRKAPLPRNPPFDMYSG